METLNMKDNLLLLWWKPSRVGPRRRGAALLLSPNPRGDRSAHLVRGTVEPVVGGPSGGDGHD
jgi:hypothetical protein